MASKKELIVGGVEAAIATAAVVMGQDLAGPAAAFAGSAIARYLLDRFDRAKTIAKNEFDRVGATPSDFRDEKQLAAGAWRYIRAARDQAADENLKILAQAMVGCARRQQLWAMDFLRYADILAPLSRDELIVLGLLMTEHKKVLFSNQGEVHQHEQIWLRVVSLATPRFANNREWVEAVAAQAQRSGLLLPFQTRRDGVGYALSPIGMKIRETVDIEAATNGVPSN